MFPMTTTTSTVEVTDVAPWLYPGLSLPEGEHPEVTVTGPVDGIWTITAPDTVTQTELDAAVALQVISIISQSNYEVIKERARLALEVNVAFLALPAPTNAQVLAQVKFLTREANALIKLGISDLSDTLGT